jgi:hypothetical protein
MADCPADSGAEALEVSPVVRAGGGAVGDALTTGRRM